MARTVRNAKLDTRTARARLAPRREPYWQVISAGCAIGYRRGTKGGSWVARWRAEDGRQRYEALGAADDIRDADDVSVFAWSQAQAMARAWFEQRAREQAGDVLPSNGPYTVADALADYRAEYLRRGGKAADRLDWSANAWILPKLGTVSLAKLTKRRITEWLDLMATTPPRLRTRKGEDQKHRAVGRSPAAPINGQPGADDP